MACSRMNRRLAIPVTSSKVPGTTTASLQQRYDQNVLKLSRLKSQLGLQLSGHGDIKVGNEALVSSDYHVASRPERNLDFGPSQPVISTTSPSKTLLLEMAHADSAAQLHDMQNQLQDVRTCDALDSIMPRVLSIVLKLIQLTSQMSTRFSKPTAPGTPAETTSP